jgi:hypothetical protein
MKATGVEFHDGSVFEATQFWENPILATGNRSEMPERLLNLKRSHPG